MVSPTILDDAPFLAQRLEKGPHLGIWILEPYPVHPLGEGGPVVCAFYAHHAVSETAYPPVELDEHLPCGGSLAADTHHGVEELLPSAHVLEPARVGHLLLGEELPAAALGTEVRERGVRAVDGDVQEPTKFRFERGSVEREDQGAPGIGDQALDPFDHPGPREYLLGEGLG
jgi:hypothetical protein